MKELDEHAWNQICSYTTNKMREHTKPYVTPISKVISDDYGELLGSGSYLKILDKKYLITNEHVARHMADSPLAHQFVNSDNVIRLTNQFNFVGNPIDFAISPIDDRSWNICNHDGMAIPLSRFAPKHEPVERELFFFVGYSGERSKFLFNTLCSKGTPYLTQESELPEEWGQPEFHFALPYPPDLAWSVDANTRGLPDPHGFSGSLVWNTRRVEYLQAEQEWIPEHAQVTGILWGWPSSNSCLLATRVEHISVSELAILTSQQPD